MTASKGKDVRLECDNPDCRYSMRGLCRAGQHSKTVKMKILAFIDEDGKRIPESAAAVCATFEQQDDPDMPHQPKE